MLSINKKDIICFSFFDEGPPRIEVKSVSDGKKPIERKSAFKTERRGKEKGSFRNLSFCNE